MNNFDLLFAKNLAGAGGSSTDNYNDLTNKPSINNVTLTGAKSSTDLGLQPEIKSGAELSADLVDDTNATHKFVTASDKNTWNGKQNALTSAQLDAVNSGIDSTKVGQIETNKTNISVDEAALVELVDGGAKNVLPIASSLSGTLANKATIASDGTITITLDAALTSEGGVNWDFPLSAGTLHFSCGENSSISGQYDCYIGDKSATPPTTVLRDNSTTPGQEATIASGNYRCTIRMHANTPAGTYTFKPMLCTKAAWDISHTYQPYRPSYQELYERVVALEQANQ